MINENWPWRPLGELFEIGAGKTMSAAARAGANKTPFLRTSNVFWDEIDLTEVDEMFISPDELENKSLKLGDLLVCEGGDIGRAAVWDGRMEVMSFQNHLHRLRPAQDGVDPRFYVYFLQSAFTQLGIFEGEGNKTTIPNLSRNRLAALDVPQPPLPEQRSIVQVLAHVREAILTHSKSTKIAEEIKQSAMRELFTKGLRGEAQKQTDIGLVPESWDAVTLNSVCVNSDQVSLAKEGDRNIHYIDVSCVSRETLAVEDTSEYALKDAPGRARKRVIKGDVIFATIRPTLRRIARIGKDLDNQVCSTAFCVLRTENPDELGQFIFYAVQRSEFIDLFSRIETGASYPAVTDKQVKAQLIPLPPTLDEQREIVSILSAIDRKIDLHRQKRKVLEELFQSLLHKLMTGEIRVSDLDLSALAKGEAA